MSGSQRSQLLALSVGLVLGAAFSWLRRGKGASKAAPSTGLVGDLESLLHIPNVQLRQIVEDFVAELTKGLATRGASIPCLPSWVRRLPTGTEQGSAYALDLGGTNFRVCEYRLTGGGNVSSRKEKFLIPEELKTGSGAALFDFIAEKLHHFVDAAEEPVHMAHVGFTFSFPCEQTSISSASLIRWTKNFTAAGVEGEDVVALTNAALARRSAHHIRIVALINDTVGTLVSQAYACPKARVGIIIGTGTNAAYLERVDRIPKIQGTPGEFMAINTEWGNYDEAGRSLPYTSYDRLVDAESQNPGRNRFEKAISGMYLGEIVRHILRDFREREGLFLGIEGIAPYAFTTRHMSLIDGDVSPGLMATYGILKEFGLASTRAERTILKRTCELVATRSAHLLAAALCALLTRLDLSDGVVVGVDGSVFEHYPYYKARWEEAMSGLIGVMADRVELRLAHDGSGIGAALVAHSLEHSS